ncbi:tripartite tricarboxylate transporter TctB family protein [Nonomuraea sp. NPDC050394]|uniref:tripartite tricarboxylate transporter TctB family protein n=1 Tax=Nonomuraea sp. NPDC050394 TaxID=3364363 RepID=UPI0037ADD240
MTSNRLAGHLVTGILNVLMLLWLWQAWLLPYTVDGRPGPGFFPVWLSAIGLVLGVAIQVAGIRAPRERASLEPDPGQHGAEPDGVGPESGRAGAVRLGGALLGGVALLVLMPLLGFVTGLAVYLAYLCVVIIRMRVIGAIAISLGTAATIHLVFAVLLGVPFPTGLLGI